MTRCVLYTRISNDPAGREAGVRRQLDECRQLAASRGWEVVDELTDNDTHANARRRPGFDAVAEAIRDGEADAVVAWRDDRLLRGGKSRRAFEFLTLVREKHTTVAFVAGEDWSFDTAQGRLMVDIRLGIAQYEIESQAERQQARWRQRKRDGKEVNLGRRPFGFKLAGREGARHLVPKPAEARAVKDAARRIIEGQSFYRVARTMPLPPPYADRWMPNKLRRMFESDLFVRHGVLTPAEDKLVKARIAKLPKPKLGQPPRRYPLSGIVVCGLCGSKLAASSGSYRCQDCGKLGVLTHYVEETVFERLADRLQHEPPPEPPRRAVENEDELLAELADVEDRLGSLADNLKLSEDTLARRARALERRRDELMGQLGQTVEARPTYVWLREWIAEGMPQSFAPDDKEWLGSLIESVTIQPAAVRGRKTFDAKRVVVKWR